MFWYLWRNILTEYINLLDDWNIRTIDYLTPVDNNVWKIKTKVPDLRLVK